MSLETIMKIVRNKAAAFPLKTFLIVGLALILSMSVRADEEVKTNIDYMFQKVAQKITVLLEKDPEFSPFGAGLNQAGTVQFIWTKSNQEMPFETGLLVIRRGLQANAEGGRLLGIATVYRLEKKDSEGKRLSQQVNIELEYIDGTAITRAVQLVEKDGVYTIGNSAEQAMEPKIFTEELRNKLGR